MKVRRLFSSLRQSLYAHETKAQLYIYMYDTYAINEH